MPKIITSGIKSDRTIKTWAVFVFYALIILIAGFSSAYAADSLSARSYVSRAQEALKAKKLEEAKKLLETAAVADPYYAPAYSGMGDVYMEMNNINLAVESYEKARRINPGNPVILTKLGAAYFKQADYQKAAEFLEEAKRLAPDNLMVYYHLGLCRRALKDNASALSNFKQLIDLMDKDRSWKEKDDHELISVYWKTHRELAEIYSGMNDQKMAAAHYEIIMKGADENFKRSVQKEYEKTVQQKSPALDNVIYILGFILILTIFYTFRRYVLLPQFKKAQDREMAALAGAKDYETLARFVLKHLKGLTKLPKALIYFAEREGSPLVLIHAENLDSRKFVNLNASWDELKGWLAINGGKPFLYEEESVEIPFIRAFPNLRELLEPVGPRLAIPFIYNDELRGIAFLCNPATSDEGENRRLKGIFARHTQLMTRIGKEVGNAADAIFRRQAAIKDTITSAYSQLHFREKLPEEINSCKLKKKSLSLLMIEPDGMGAIHKRFSEEGKNNVLKTVYQIIERDVRKSVDTVFRISDYRFAVILPGFDEPQGTETGELIRGIIADTKFTAPIPNITVSMGLAVYPKDAEGPDMLEEEARRALDKAISTGRNKLLTPSSATAEKSVVTDPMEDMGPLTQHLSMPVDEGVLFNYPSRESVGEQKTPEKTDKPSVNLAGLKFRSASVSMRMEGAGSSPVPLSVSKGIADTVSVRPQKESVRKETVSPQSAPMPVPSNIRNLSDIQAEEEYKNRKRSLRKKESDNEPVTSKLPSLAKVMGAEKRPIKRVRRFKDAYQVKPVEKDPFKSAETDIKEIVASNRQSRLSDLKSLAQSARRKLQVDGKASPVKDADSELLDQHTGFYIKSHFEKNIGPLLIKASQTKQPLSIMFFKLDKHRALKEAYGQEKLNGTLKEICTMISSFLNEDNDIPFRYNDEVFGVVMPGTTFQVAFNVAEQIRFTVGNLIFADIPGQITISLGMSSFPEKGKSPKELMKASYEAMVYAIKAGGNKSVIWDDKLKDN